VHISSGLNFWCKLSDLGQIVYGREMISLDVKTFSIIPVVHLKVNKQNLIVWMATFLLKVEVLSKNGHAPPLGITLKLEYFNSVRENVLSEMSLFGVHCAT
jgi:hypothetical protein